MNINELRNALDNGVKIEYTAHCQKRMLEREISRADIINCIYTGEIIEEHPLDENNRSESSLPSCLILGFKVIDKKAIHIVVGYNGTKMLMISACYPTSEHWLEDNKTRRI